MNQLKHPLQLLDPFSLQLIHELQERSLDLQRLLATDNVLKKVSDAVFTITEIHSMPIDCNIYFPIQLCGNIYITQAKKLWSIEFLQPSPSTSTTSSQLSSPSTTQSTLPSSIRYERCNSEFLRDFRRNLFHLWWNKAVCDGFITRDNTLENWTKYLGGDLHNWTSLDFAYTAKWICMGENPIIPPWYVREFFQEIPKFSPDSLFPCVLCGKWISNLTDLEDHCLSHSKLCLKCKVCGQRYTSTSKSIEHFQDGHCFAVNCTTNMATLYFVDKIREKYELSRRSYEAAYRGLAAGSVGVIQQPFHVNVPRLLEINNNSNNISKNDNSCAPSIFSVPPSTNLHSSHLGICRTNGNPSLSSLSSFSSMTYPHHHPHHPQHSHRSLHTSPPLPPLPPPPSPSQSQTQSQPEGPNWRPTPDPMAYLNSISPYQTQSNGLYHIPSHSRAVIASPENYQDHSVGITNRLPHTAHIGNIINKNDNNNHINNHSSSSSVGNVVFQPQCMMKNLDKKLLIEESSSSDEHDGKCRPRREMNVSKSSGKKKVKIFPQPPPTYQMGPLNYSVKCDGVQYDIGKQ